MKKHPVPVLAGWLFLFCLGRLIIYNRKLQQDAPDADTCYGEAPTCTIPNQQAPSWPSMVPHSSFGPVGKRPNRKIRPALLGLLATADWSSVRSSTTSRARIVRRRLACFGETAIDCSRPPHVSGRRPPHSQLQQPYSHPRIHSKVNHKPVIKIDNKSTTLGYFFFI